MVKKEQKDMKLSARNQLKGKVKKVEHGAVNSEVSIELAGGVEVVSIITKEAAEHFRSVGRQDGICGYQGERRNDCY